MDRCHRCRARFFWWVELSRGTVVHVLCPGLSWQRFWPDEHIYQLRFDLFAMHQFSKYLSKLACRSPPEAVKRILAACWLLLHCQRFKDKPISAVRFDEVQLKRISNYTAKWETFQDQKRLTKRNRSNTGYQTRWMSGSWIRDLQFPPFGQKTDWPRCQRMLVDEAHRIFWVHSDSMPDWTVTGRTRIQIWAWAPRCISLGVTNPFLLLLNVPQILKTGVHLQFQKISDWPIWLLIDPL